MANKEIKATAKLFLDTKNAQNDAKQFVNDIKQKLSSIETAADKMTVFKDLVGYIGQVDQALTALKNKNKDAFDRMFSGIDSNLKKEFESIFGVTKEQLSALAQLKNKVTLAKSSDTTTGADLKPLEQEVRSLYKAAGMIDKLDLSGKGKVETRIKKLETALDGFAAVWSTVNQKISNGFNFGDANGSNDEINDSIKNITNNIKKGINELDELKKIAKQKVKEFYNELIGNYDLKKMDSIKQSLKEALSFDDKEFLNFVDIFNDLEYGDIEEDEAVKQIVEAATKIKAAKQELNDAIKGDNSTETMTPEQVLAGDNIEKDTKETVKVIDIAKKKIVDAWKEYYNATIEAQEKGLETKGKGAVTPEMDNIQYSIEKMLDKFNINDKKAKYDLSSLGEYISDGDIGIDDIENEVNKIFQKYGATVDIPLDQISFNISDTNSDISKLADKTQETTNKMTSSLGNVEIKTNDVASAFQELINYISQSGQSPQSFFIALENSALMVDNELQNILKSLNLLDGNGGVNIKSLTSGFSNSGGMISDDYVLVSREQKKLSYSLDAKQKTAEAKALGANIGAVLEVYEDKVNGLIYELQNKVSGKGILDFKKGIVNTDFLEATDEQIKNLLNDLQILQQTGLYVDWNGNNILYDKENGFSFIDFFTKSVPGITVGESNTVQENLSYFFSQVLGNFALDDSAIQKLGDFDNRVEALLSKQNNLQQVVKNNLQDTMTTANAATSSINQEENAHEQNANTINAENQALQAQIELKKKAQSMKWTEFALDESMLDLKKLAGVQSLSDLEKFWKQANYDKNINFTELSPSEMKRIIDNDPEVYKLRNKWYTDQDFDAKNLLENKVLENDELRNAAMNKLWQLYQEETKQAIDFYDFVNKEIEVYRGDVAPALYNDQQKHSFSFSKDVALSFINDWELKPGEKKEDYLKTIKISPKETLGNLATSSFEHEYELWIPNSKSPYVDNINQSFDEYYKGLDDVTQKALDYKLIQLEKSRVANLLGEDVLDSFQKFTNDGVKEKFNQGEIPKQIDLTGDFYDDSFAQIYNNLPELQKKLFVYYQSLLSLSTSLSDDLFSYGEGTYGLSKKIGKTNITNAVVSDPSGVQQHVSNLTGESKFGIFGQEADTVQQEAIAHQKNTQAIQAETQAQQALNNAKTSFADRDKFFTTPDDDLDLDGFNLDDYDNSVSESQKQLQVEQEITTEKQKQAAIDNSDSNAFEIQDIPSEINTLDSLLIKINEVKQAVEAKTNAFKEEGSVVTATINEETQAFQLLLTQLQEVLNQVSLIGESFTKANTEIAELKSIKDIDKKENITSEIVAEKASETMSQSYALDSTLLNTNGILENILVAIGNNESFSQLVDQLNAAVAELKSVASGIVEHQKSQRTDLTDASAKIANNYGQLSSIAGNAVAGLGDNVQIENMKALADNVVRVRGAVQDASGVWKGFVVDINESNNAVINAVNEQSKFAKSLNESAEAAKKAESETKKQESPKEDKFTKDLTNQKNALKDYKDSLKDVDYLNDELNNKLSNLGTSLDNVVDTKGLEKWKNDFQNVKEEVSVVQEVFNKLETEKLKGIRNNLNSEFKTLDFTTTVNNPTVEQQEILNLRKQLITEIEKQTLAVERGKNVELSSINTIVTALKQKINAYRDANDLASGGGKKFGSTAVLNATAKFNSLKQRANSDEFAHSQVVQQALSRYEAAYNKLITKRKELAQVEKNGITDTQKSEFKRLQTECNDAAKALDKIITKSKELEANSIAHGLLGDDFDDSVNGRKSALQDFVEATYGASAKIGEFKDNFNQLTFVVDNGDGTFTEMTASINAARTAIDATAGTTQKATGAFESFINEVKGKFKSISAYLISMVGIQEVWQQIRQGVTYVKEIDSALTELKKVTNETDQTYQNFLQTASQTASVIGSNVADFTNATADFARLGYSIDEAANLAKTASVYKNVGDGIEDVSQASESIISTMKAFGIEANDAMGIVDRFNEVGNNFAISSTGIGEAMQRSASALYEAGNTIDESIGLVTAANSVIQNPEQVGK